jgi:5-methylcytosine-specific restriction endonuclease McrA
VLAGDRLKELERRGKPYFCDRQCVGDWKSFYYKEKEYQTNKATNPRHIVYPTKQDYLYNKLRRGWKVCIMCGDAYQGGGIVCSGKCSSRRGLILRKTIKTFVCKQCGKQFTRFTEATKLKYCSLACGRRSRSSSLKLNKRIRSTATMQRGLSWRTVMKKDKKRCKMCGCKCVEPTGGSFQTSNEATLDHVIPLAKGGLHCIENAQLLCRGCNTAKSDKLPSGVQMLLPF